VAGTRGRNAQVARSSRPNYDGSPSRMKRARLCFEGSGAILDWGAIRVVVGRLQ